MALARYTKSPAERKKYQIDYSQWLLPGEQITTVTFVVTPDSELEIDASAVTEAGTVVIFYANHGVDQREYKVEVFVNTTEGQKKEDVITFTIEDP